MICNNDVFIFYIINAEEHKHNNLQIEVKYEY